MAKRLKLCCKDIIGSSYTLFLKQQMI